MAAAKRIGKINNLAVDLESGRVLYAIVDVEGGNRVRHTAANSHSVRARRTWS